MRNIRKILSVLLGMAMMGTNVSAAYTERTTTADNSLPQPISIVDALAAEETRVHPEADISGNDTNDHGFEITYAEPEGEGSISGWTEASGDETVELTVSPSEGWMLKSLRIEYPDKQEYLSEEFDTVIRKYSFTMPTSDVTIHATFVKINYYTLNDEYFDHGHIWMDPSPAHFEDEVTLHVEPDSGYVLAEITVLDAKGNTIDLTDAGNNTYTFTMPASDVTINAAFEYPLWIGDTQVTSKNADAILGDDSISYDPESGILTFAEADPQITGLHENALIYSDLDALHIQADNGLNLNSDTAAYAIYTSGYLSIDGDLTVTNPGGGGIRVTDDDVNITGDVQLSTKTEGIYAEGYINIEGNITADAANGNILHSSNGVINVNGNTELSGNTYEILAYGGVTVFGEATLTNGISSENGYVNLFGKVTISSSQQDCAIFSKEDINLDEGADITAKGIGLCSAEGSIAVSEKTNIASGQQCIYIPSENPLWLDGDTILTLTGRDVPAVDVKGDVYINGNLKVSGNASISVSAGGAIETDGIVEIINGKGIGLYAENGPITINEGTWDITGTPAVKTKGDIDIPYTALVLIPENGPVGEFEDYSTVLDGYTAAEHVYIISSYMVSFDKGDKEAGGTMPTVFVGVDSDYKLPACSFEAPASKVFKEWNVKVGDADAYTALPGEYIYPNADTVVTAVWETPELPVFYGHSVILSGSIGMNFYVIVPDAFVPDSRIILTSGTGDNARTVEIPTSEAKETKHGYLFTLPLTSVEMADEIAAEFHYLKEGKDAFISCTTSVESYLEILATDPAYSDAANLAMAINNYGYYAQLSLPDGPNHVQMTGTYDELPLPEELDESYPITFSPTDDITGGSFSLSLDSDTVINFYLSPASAVTGTVAVTRDNSPVDFEAKTYNGMYLISIPGIGAHLLGDVYTVTIDDEPIISGSALSYVEKTWDNENLTEATRNTSKALYGYYQEAIYYSPSTEN